jgi:hypothetical protein
MLGVGSSAAPLIVLPCFLVIGFGIAFVGPSTNAGLQQHAPMAMRGALAGLYILCHIGMLPIGYVLAGSVAQHLPVQFTFIALAMTLAALFQQLNANPRGLFVITGRPSTGKTVTAYAMLDFLNRNTSGHIETVEDPIEFPMNEDGCMFTQREVGFDDSGRACTYLSLLERERRTHKKMPRNCPAGAECRCRNLQSRRRGELGRQLTAGQLPPSLI